ncbi:2Fe-2S iron-sulfur cluster-binding protein [Alkalihalobacillus sp. BA299]|uniref:(2Fe-2S)-binding protein n=1 Tax=Alkalihalobacillus sp. BA299 TaxID=2815938 RepID=UPI0027DAF835|nr:2Fe-2S iron-sulfur cluster-binding protein [Alkalihalobacillus sp. BA299]
MFPLLVKKGGAHMSLSKDSLENIEEVDSTVSFVLNGEVMTLNVDPSKRLIEIIRDDLNLTGTKISCEIGRCGACMVLINGKPQNSCLTMAYQCEGKSVVTIEGLSKEKLDPVQQILLEEGGLQCGYCTSGMVVSVKGILKQCPNASFEDLREGLSGNLCRCTGYGGILRSLERISKECTVKKQE